MKSNTRINIYLLALASTLMIWMISCSSKHIKDIDLAETMIKTSPYTADSILASINDSSKLNKELLAKWCLLKCIISDSINTPMPQVSIIEETYDFYKAKKDWTQMVKSGFYLGLSYKESEDYDKAIDVFLFSLTKAKELKDYTLVGYIYSCIANIHELNKDIQNAEKDYEFAKNAFLQANNTKSYILALKNIARQKAYQNSLDEALNILHQGDSIARTLNDTSVFVSIYNTLGNIYCLMGDYEKAEDNLLKSASLDTNSLNNNYLALTQMYLNVANLDKANYYLNKVDSNDNKYKGTIAYYKYLYEKERKNYMSALENYEIWNDTYIDETMKKKEENILELEKKYDQAINETKLQELKISRLVYIVILCLSLICLFILHTLFRNHKKKMNNKIISLEEKINSINKELDVKKKELDIKKNEIEANKKDLEKLDELEHEIDGLSTELKQIKYTLLKNSSSGKKIADLAQKFIPNNKEALIDEKLYKAMEKDIRSIYPKYKALILEFYPEISISEWQYCCLLIFGLDNKSESRLLCVAPQSVRTRRLRLRKKLGIELEDMSIYEYLIDKII
ncbi:hypothetical protein CE91St1_01160 [Parabacteroides goldsteinii]|nr:tetratricopeptide repeat protein [Parabacteroides goldsteinii]GKG70973.1 hypothetical protein CE91St1_01160 [Parabacteroides goldsteinii]GKG76924.1 hypothetical protein CE91St2_01160 [Parabacteroides goldsteinii]